MDVIEIGGEQYEIYTRQEADNRDIDYTYWKDVEEPGGYALTDDDYVAEVRFVYDTSGSKQVVTAAGRCWANDHGKINWEEYKAVGNTSFNRPQTHWEYEAKRKRGQRAVNFYAQQIVNGVPHKLMPWDIIGRIYKPDDEEPSWSAQLLFKQRETMKEVNKEIIRILDEQGLSDSDVARGYKDLLDEAKDSEDLTNWRLTLDSVSKMRGIDKPKEKHRLLEETVDMSREIGEGIQKERQQIKATRRSQLDADDE